MPSMRILDYTISIHTPAKGVTCKLHRNQPMFLYFNPHPREGGDARVQYSNFFRNGFQSTPPRRG